MDFLALVLIGLVCALTGFLAGWRWCLLKEISRDVSLESILDGLEDLSRRNHPSNRKGQAYDDGEEH